MFGTLGYFLVRGRSTCWKPDRQGRDGYYLSTCYSSPRRHGTFRQSSVSSPNMDSVSAKTPGGKREASSRRMGSGPRAGRNTPYPGRRFWASHPTVYSPGHLDHPGHRRTREWSR